MSLCIDAQCISLDWPWNIKRTIKGTSFRKSHVSFKPDEEEQAGSATGPCSLRSTDLKHRLSGEAPLPYFTSWPKGGHRTLLHCLTQSTSPLYTINMTLNHLTEIFRMVWDSKSVNAQRILHILTQKTQHFNLRCRISKLPPRPWGCAELLPPRIL